MLLDSLSINLKNGKTVEKLGKKEPFHIGTGADIRPQKRSRKITE
jgi:hypothetical protein